METTKRLGEVQTSDSGHPEASATTERYQAPSLQYIGNLHDLLAGGGSKCDPGDLSTGEDNGLRGDCG
jgi:hypothetical protein